MKQSILSAISVLAVTISVSQAAYVTNFNSAAPTGGAGNFAPQDGWVISDSELDLSLVIPVSSYGNTGNSVGLGGLAAAPNTLTTRLSHAVSEPLSGSTFAGDYSLINRNGADPLFLEDDDQFGFVLLSGATELFTLKFSPTATENFRQISVNGVNLGSAGIVASDYDAPAWYSFSVTFTASGADLLYSGTAAVGAPFSGTIPGGAALTATSIGVDFNVLGATPGDAGSNLLFVDNISIPEPSAMLTGLLALGMLTGARRRK
ncbi:MAG: hypothetical protein JWL81_1083 [Verrucomicrobiales bacterium]|nr:hypothetical protein [Verrucomicrobiales bacterium]